MVFQPGGPGESAQGTLIAVSPDPNWPDNNPQGGALAFVTIAQLGDIDPPELSRKEIEITNQNASDDQYIVGIRRKGTLDFKLNFVPSEPTQNNLSTNGLVAAGLQYRWYNASRDIYRVTYPDGITQGSQWIFSGYIKSIKVSAHIDAKLEANVSIRPTGNMIWNAAS